MSDTNHTIKELNCGRLSCIALQHRHRHSPLSAALSHLSEADPFLNSAILDKSPDITQIYRKIFGEPCLHRRNHTSLPCNKWSGHEGGEDG